MDLLVPEFQRKIGELCADYESFERQLNIILHKQNIDFYDLQELEGLKTMLEKSQLRMNYQNEFNDLFNSYVWVIKAATRYNVKANS